LTVQKKRGKTDALFGRNDKKRPLPFRQGPWWVGSAAAAENNQQRNDDEPDPVIVEQVAKTVIHPKVLHSGIKGIALR
jgi:hypothetical protein